MTKNTNRKVTPKDRKQALKLIKKAKDEARKETKKLGIKSDLTSAQIALGIEYLARLGHIKRPTKTIEEHSKASARAALNKNAKVVDVIRTMDLPMGSVNEMLSQLTHKLHVVDYLLAKHGFSNEDFRKASKEVFKREKKVRNMADKERKDRYNRANAKHSTTGKKGKSGKVVHLQPSKSSKKGSHNK